MTTYPGRLRGCYLTIESILEGRVSPDLIVLWLAKEEMNDSSVPGTLLRQQRRGLDVRYVDDNYRSANKLVHALKAFPDAIIVTADDDILYPRDWLAELINVHEQQGDVIICHRGHYLGTDESGNLLPYGEVHDSGIGGIVPSYNLLPTGVSGILYPPYSLDPRVSDLTTYREVCPTSDDIWFRAMSILAGTKARRVRSQDSHFPTIRRSQGTSLMNCNLQGGENDRALKRVFERYDITRYLED